MHHSRWFHKTVYSAVFLTLGACSTMSPPATPTLVLGPHQIVVQSGDTLYGIASRYGVSLKQLMTLNRLSSSHIQVGQVLLLPQKRGAPEPKVTELEPLAVQPLEPLGPPAYTPLNEEGLAMDASVAQEIAAEQKLNLGPVVPLAGGGAALAGTAGTVASSGATASASALSAGASSVSTTARSGLVWPVKGDVVTQFSEIAGKRFDGIEIAGKAGDSVAAAQEGTVVICKNNYESLGNVVVVKGPGGALTAYGHLADFAVKKGDVVSPGTVVGTMGRNGKVYFEYRPKLKGGPVNPVPLLGGAG